MLKSKTHFPPGGFEFYQPESGWRANPWVGFNEVVQQIKAHRQANPRFNLATDEPTIAAQLEQFTEARIRQTFPTQIDQWIISPAPGGPDIPFFIRRSPRPRGEAAAGGNAVEKVKKIAAGVGTIWEWLGEGLKPVPIEVASSRAVICAGCEFNRPAEGIQKLINTVGTELHSLMEARSHMDLSTPSDDKLHTCVLCDCVLRLKVFAPIKHIAAHTADELRDSLPPWCWIKAEMKQIEQTKIP